MLTKRQAALLNFIADYTDEHGGVAPSYDEIASATGVTKSCIGRALDILEARGFIRRLPHRARAVEVLKRPPEGSEPPIDRAKRNLAIARRALAEVGGVHFGATLALIAIKTAMEHLGEGKP